MSVKTKLKERVQKVKAKADKLETVIHGLKEQEFLKKPGIQNLVEKVKTQATQKAHEVSSKVKEQAQKAQELKKTIKEKDITKDLRDLVRPNDLANKIASQILVKAEELREQIMQSVPVKKARNLVKRNKKTSKSATSKKASKKKTAKSGAKKAKAT